MKADKWGTPTEQHRFRINWLSGSKNANKTETRCQNCIHYDETNFELKITRRCATNDFNTQINSVCRDHRETKESLPLWMKS